MTYNPKLEQIVDENLKAWPRKIIKKVKKHMEEPLSTERYDTVEDALRKSMKKRKLP